MEQNTTRRAALGILATGPIAVLPALAVMQCSTRSDAAISSPEWDRTISVYRKALAEHVAFKRDHLDPANDAYDRAVGRDARAKSALALRPIENREAELHLAAFHAAQAAFHVPSPTFAAFDEKMAMIDRYHEGDDFDAPWDNLNWIRADVQRLAKIGGR